MVARIFRPSKTAMQSGRGKTERWLLLWDADSPRSVEPLMGYTSAADMTQQIRLAFDTCAEAVGYAERRGIPFEVEPEQQRTLKTVSYSDNFRPGRRSPWTH